MLQKWKSILSNWINCYFKETNKKDLAVNLESLLEIISHLRENLNNSISNSSILDAQSVQEFLLEKYPDFKFENGTVEPETEDDVYLAASLLLFFVCVNSKDLDLKHAMCCKLSSGDQETILKFSKHLMECPNITNMDVLTAITESCGQDTATLGEKSMHVMVAETPPPLRSLHSEVRRLQAALDAERFDRTYLQEELTRTNIKVEKLLKDKEQYKLEIVDLKAQLLLCGGQDKESHGDNVEDSNTNKLMKQLHQMEQRLMGTQEQLEDVQNEKESYKAKLNQLKLEYDELLTHSQQETSRANSLAEELMSERQRSHSLQELVAELQQHNHLNRIDSSFLECDDPDASIRSLQHNSSACSEVCANVIEVQLGEERATIVALKQQMQLLQEQLCDVTRKAEENKQSLSAIIMEKENTIMDLKHRVNEEIEEKNTLKAIFDDDVAKLNNELNELEQRLKGSQENSRHIIETKMQEIQNLQEEKLSLLQSLSDETTKLENKIKDLQYEVDAEKSSKIRFKEEYDNHIMKLNEKVLNRNNELVELQNKIFEEGEKIEDLQLKLRREKEIRDDLSNKHKNDIKELNSIRERAEQDLQQKSEEANDLHKYLQQHISIIENINKENDHIKTVIIQLQKDCQILKDTKENLLIEIKNRDVKAEQMYKETENLKNLLFEEKQSLQHHLQAMTDKVNTLQVQLQTEIQLKKDMQCELQKYKDEYSSLVEKTSKLNSEIEKCMLEKEKKEITIQELNESLLEKQKLNESLKIDLKEVDSKLEKLTKDTIDNNKIIKDFRNELEKNKNEYCENLQSKNDTIKALEAKLASEVYEKAKLHELCNSLRKEKDISLELHKEKDNKLLQLQSEYEMLFKTNKESKEKLLAGENSEKELQDIVTQKDLEIEQLKAKINNLQQALEDDKLDLSKLKETYNQSLETKNRDIQTLQQENQSLNNELNDVRIQLETKVHSLKDKLIDNEHLTDKLKQTYDCQIDNLNTMVNKLTNYLKDKTIEIDLSRKEKEKLQKIVEDNAEIIKTLEEEIKSLKHDQEKLLGDIESERLVLKNMVTVTESVMEDQKVSLNKIISEHSKSNEVLQEKNKMLQNMLDNEKKNTEIQIKDKEYAIDMALKELCNLKRENVELENNMKSQIQVLKDEITNLEHEVQIKGERIKEITEENTNINNCLLRNNNEAKDMEEEIKSLKNTQIKLIQDFETEKLELKNKISFAESAMEAEKVSLNNIISENFKSNERLREENKALQNLLQNEKSNAEKQISDQDFAKTTALKELNREKAKLESKINKLNHNLQIKEEQVRKIIDQNKQLNSLLEKYKKDITDLEEKCNEWKIKKEAAETELTDELKILQNELTVKSDLNKKLESLLEEKSHMINETQATVKVLHERINNLDKQKASLEFEKNECVLKLEEMKRHLDEKIQNESEEFTQLKHNNQHLLDILEDKKSEIIKLESLLMYEKQQNKLMQDDNNNEKINLTNKCSILEEYQLKAEQELENRQKEIELLVEEVKQERDKAEKNLKDRDELMAQLRHEKDSLISKLSKELIDAREKCLKETEYNIAAVNELRKKLEDVTRSETDTVKLLRKENEVLKRTLALKETFAVASQENSSPKSAAQSFDTCNHQVDTTPTNHTHSSLESHKTISDLEKIIQDRNRTITALQSDITYMKTMMAESENQLLDVTKDLEVSKENCQQLSSQLKKMVHQKNEEIADLKKQLTKMSVTENRASQIIKVSAKYQAMILKRIAEIKSNTVLKELTNFGNSGNCDNELRRSLNAGTVTMEDLENFLDTTDRHLRRCSEKQQALQKERDRLLEVNKINESEIINMKKFLTELSVSIKTFNSVKELYTQKLSRVVSLQRTVRREILSLDGHLTDATMCRLQRDYAGAMQDLAECAMNLERWVERSIGRAISPEKIKQAFAGDERFSLAPTTFQHDGLEVQLEELDKYFCKLLEDVARAQKDDGAKEVQAVTMMEVRAEYEDKLNRMKAKMKQLYQEQIGIFKEKQREEILLLEQELQKARDKLEESSRAYEEHIRSLTTELWNVGEKFLMKKDEAEWLRRKQRNGSLMSLQHVHSSGLVPPQEEPSRPSDTHSLHSLPVSSNTNSKNEGRGLHMSDEEGEVFDNRCVRELARTPRPARTNAPHRLSELQWRNSLCPPHLKSSYPAETQFAPAVHEDDIKCASVAGMAVGARSQRKEVGITAYKKPGPPTPSKQAGRLSATDSELRESLRVENEPNASRKTSTPSRIRSLFRSNKADTVEGTPRSRRLSNIFRKK